LIDPFMLARTIHFASVAMLSGLMFFLLFVSEPVVRRMIAGPDEAVTGLRRQLVLVGWIALGVSAASGAAWLLLLAARLSGQSVAAAISGDVVWKVLTETRFGDDWLARMALAALLAAWLVRLDPVRGWRSWQDGATAVLLSGCFIASLAWAGHGGASPGVAGVIQLAGDALHLAAAGAWIGGLVPFVVVMASARRARSETWSAIAAEVTVRFSAFGVVVVAGLLITGLLNSWFLVGSVPGLVGTGYGQLLLAKIALVVVMVGIAAVNRMSLMPRLRHSAQDATLVLGRLQRNGLIETALGVAILGIVGALGTVPPAAHTQASWPFPVRFSAAALDDPVSRLSTLLALAAVACGAASILGGLFAGRLRWPALAAGVLLIALAAPRLGRFAVEAFPTSFYASPTGFSARSVAAGAALFAQHCASCHGPQGRGDGPAAKDLTPPPADLTVAHIYEHRDGDLYWWITKGIGNAMPPFGAALDETARWNIIDFIHANADARRLGDLEDSGPMIGAAAPDFFVECRDGSTFSLVELRGSIVHLIFAGTRSAARLRDLGSTSKDPDITTLAVRLDPSVSADGTFCGTDDPDVPKAFALYAGAAVDELEGTEFLIDQAGSLRSLWHPGLEPVWTDPRALADVIATIRRTTAVPHTAAAHVHE
jgi:putative copper export protein/mono/diheme cytochrome c family protein